MTYQKRIGRLGEALASEYLKGLGYQFLDQNYHTRYGELDLVFLDEDSIVFAEVKTRTSSAFGSPESSITTAKIEHIQDAALLWLQDHPDTQDDWRIDVIAILLDSKGNPKDIQHFINVNL